MTRKSNKARRSKSKTAIKRRKKVGSSRKISKSKPGKSKKEPGYKMQNKIYIPDRNVTKSASEDLVKPSKLIQGIEQSKKEIRQVLAKISDEISGMDEYLVNAIEVSLSFSADGKFLGVGVGGGIQVSISFTPIEDS